MLSTSGLQVGIVRGVEHHVEAADAGLEPHGLGGGGQARGQREESGGNRQAQFVLTKHLLKTP